jgi:RluA family pseudouridine synthase
MKTLSFSIERSAENMVLLDFLASTLSLSRRKAKELIDSRNVFVNRKRVWMARHILKPGDKVECAMENRHTRQNIPFEALYEDDSFMIINKRSGILSNGPDSAESTVQTLNAAPDTTAAHRLDRDTSGCLLLAKTSDAMEKIIGVFSGREVKKIYHVIASGRFMPPDQTVTAPIDGRQAVTHFRTLNSNNEASHLQARIETGRTHQIRRHLAGIGFPVLGDKHYGTRFPAGDKAIRLGRQMLHASSIEFTSPFDGRKIRASAPLPRDFRRCLQIYNLT